MFEMAGTEALTIELQGSIAAAEAQRLVAGTGLDPEIGADGRAIFEVLMFDMRGLGMRGIPGPRFDYGEALFRLGVIRAGEPSFLGVACDIDHPMVRRFGAMLVRYPVREASFSFDDGGSVCKARVESTRGSLSIRAWVSDDGAPALPPRPLYVREESTLYRVPWQEEPAPFRRWARMEVRGQLGEATMGGDVVWEERAMVHRGRIHRCGRASKVRA